MLMYYTISPVKSCLLPWHAAGVTVVIVFEVYPELFAGTVLPGGTLYTLHVGEVACIPPCPWDNHTVRLLPVKVGILQVGKADPHQGVKCQTRLGDLGGCLGGGHEGGEEAPETVGKDAESIFNHPPGTRTPVVEYSLVVREVPVGEGFHQVCS